MGGPRPSQFAAGQEPAARENPMILLTGPVSDVERALVRRWLKQADVRPSAVLALDGPGLERSLAAIPP